MAKTNLKTASVLAFERKLANSYGLMSAGLWDNRADSSQWQALGLQTKDVRGTISNRLKAAVASDPAKLDAEIQKANLQTVDVAALPAHADTLKLSFTLRVLGDLATPSACNDQDYQAALGNLINNYDKEQGFGVLAARYAENIANGRFLWRNRIGATALEVQVTLPGKQTLVFDASSFNLRNFSTSPSAELQQLTEVLRQGLAGEAQVLLHIAAFAQLGEGQEVFPSQELALDNKDSKKRKFLYAVNDVASLHSQKIGNALRTIDTWYPGAEELGPIAVEPYGAVTNRGKAYRQPKEKTDFYSLLDNWVLKNEVPAPGQQHYVIATLIRGGVFGDAGKE